MDPALPADVRVLHVDDDPAFLEVVSAFLEREFEHFTVASATTPDEGLAVLAREPVDCVISDYDMPRTSGLEFLDAVRAEHPALPFVLFTGKGSEEIAGEAISRGVSDYLQKRPGTDQLRVLANSVENVVAKAAVQREIEETRDWYSTLLANVPDFVFVVDEGGEIRYCSPSVEPIMGYLPDDLVGTTAFEYVHPDDVETAMGAFTRVLDHPDREVAVGFRAEHSDGSWRRLEVRGRNLLDDPVIGGVVVSSREATARPYGARDDSETASD